MAILATQSPISQYFDLGGDPLDSGRLYFGAVGQNPETNPVTVYWDSAGTQPAAQPILTMNGYAMRTGKPATVFANGNYSLTVRNRRGELVLYVSDSSTISNDNLLQDQIDALDQRIDDIADPSDVLKGDALVAVHQPITGAKDRTQHQKNFDTVSILDFLNVTGDGTTDDRLGIIAAMETAATEGVTLYVPRRDYACSDWIPLPSGLKMYCEPGAKFILTNDTGPVGGFFIGGYDIDLNFRPFADVDIHNLTLDCNSIAGENAFNAVNADGVRLVNPCIFNTVHSPVRLGGRAFQFEGQIVTGVFVWNPTIENCSIGINSQADANGGSARSANINYFNVTMRNVDIPFNVDGQYLNFQNVTLQNFSTNVFGGALWNCGKITWPGNSGSTGGGIITGDRGSGLRVNGLRIINETSYGGIGALVRGFIYGIEVNDVVMDVPSMTAVFDFNMVGFGDPSAAATLAWAIGSGIRVKSNLDYIVKGSGNGIGPARITCAVSGTAASLTSLVDTNAATQAPDALVSFENTDDGVNTGGLKSPKVISDAGNAFVNFSNLQTGIAEVRHVKACTDEVVTNLFKIAAPNQSRVSIVYQICAMYPQSATDAAVSSQTGVISAVVDGGGVFAKTVTSTSNSIVLDSVSSHTVTVDLTFSSSEIFLTVNQNNEPNDAICDVYIVARVIYSQGGTRIQPKITLL